MSNNLNDISKIYLDQIASINKKDIDKDLNRWTQTEAKVDTGSAAEKATARNKRNTPAGKDYDFDTKVFITRKPGESLDSARTRTRQKAHAAKRGVKESFSSWRTDLSEVIGPITEPEAEKEVKEKSGIKNKVIINPKLTEAINEIGGELLEVTEYDPLESAVEYFYEQGINEEGIDLIIEEVGLEDFVDFVDFIHDETIFINEERKARKMNVRTLKATKKKAEEIKADKSDVVKRGTPVDTVRRARAERAFKKPKLAKPTPKSKKDYDGDGKKETPKQEHRGVRNKKITKAVAKVKPAQPKKPASKEGLRTKISTAYKAGVKRHRKATQAIRVAHKGAKKAPKAIGTFLKKAKGVLDANKEKTVNMQSYEPEGELITDEVGISSSAAMEKARTEAELRKKEQDIVKDVKKNFGAEDAAKKKHKEKFGGVAEAVKGQDTESRREGAKERAADKKSGKILKNTLDSKSYATQQKKSIEWHDKRTKGRFSPGQVSDANEEVVLEKDLNAAERRALPDSDFVFPGKGEGPKGKQRGAYPIPDKKHARNALAMAAAHASPEKEAKVKAAVKKKFPGIKVSEDKAFDNVVAALRKKHGESSVITKDSPKPKPPTEAQKKKASADRKKRQDADNKAFAGRAKKAGYKSTQDYANVVARYGSEDNMKKGRGLGT